MNTHKDPILVIMAAGLGSRYGGDKQLDPVTPSGDIIMDFSLYDAYRAGFRRVVLVIRAEMEAALSRHLSARTGGRCDIRYAYQSLRDLPPGYALPEGRSNPWGTGHAVLTARPYVDAPFAVINADDYYGREAFEKLYAFLTQRAEGTEHAMVGFRIDNTLSENGSVKRGICSVSGGFLRDIEEHVSVARDDDGRIRGIDTGGQRQEIADGAPVSMNLWGFAAGFMSVLEAGFPAALDRILREDPLRGEYFLPSCINEEIQAGRARVTVLASGDRWFGITYREDKPAVMAAFAQMKAAGRYPEAL